MLPKRHVPIRTCVVCGAKKPKSAVLRLGLQPETSAIILDRQKGLPGRGAYVCPECFPQLRLTPRVRKAFANRAVMLALDDPENR